MTGQTPNNNLKKYEVLISIWKRWDESYWMSFYVFVVIMGLLFAGYSQIIQVQKLLAFLFCIAGIIISILWIYILHRKLANIYLAQDTGKKLENTIFSDKNGCFTMVDDSNSLQKIAYKLNCRKKFTKKSSGKLVAYDFPRIMIVTWMIIALITLYFWFIS